MYIVKIFHCDFCKKVLSKKAGMAKHEAECPHNPASSSCVTCSHFHMVPKGHFEYPRCDKNNFEQNCRHPRNPFGLRRKCPHHVADPYRTF